MQKILTLVIDGIGIRDEEYGNAVKQANIPHLRALWDNYPHSLLDASGLSVGLLEGQPGNCEIGHLTIGSGRKIRQCRDIALDLFKNEDEESLFYQEILSDNKKTVHLVGTLSDNNIVSNINNFIYCYNLLVERGFKKVFFHFIADGIFNNYSIDKDIKKIEDLISGSNIGSIVSLIGRNYVYTTDSLKVKRFYDLLVSGDGISVIDIHRAIKSCYEKKLYDADIKPLIFDSENCIKPGDIILWLDYDKKLSCKIVDAFTNDSFDDFEVRTGCNYDFYSLFAFDKKIKAKYLLERDISNRPLGVYLSELDMTQARIATKSRMNCITEYFDGYKKEKLSNVDKYEIECDNANSFVEKLELECVDITKRIIKCLEKDYDFVIANYSAGDEISKKGSLEKTIKMLEVIDKCVDVILKSAEDNFYKVVLVSDHGSCEEMLDEIGEVNYKNTLSLVPFVIVDNKVVLAPKGDLTMVAPTILTYMEIAIPKEMHDSEILIK